jgi:hypothetical protein
MVPRQVTDRLPLQAEGHGAFYLYEILIGGVSLYTTHKGPGGSHSDNHTAEEGEDRHWGNDPDITGEDEIDLGLRRRSTEELFIKGPIPLADYVAALKLGGKTVGVFTLIHHRTVYSRRRWITLPTYALEDWGISIDAKTDALKRLVQVGLIAVRRPKGRSLQVELLRKPKNWNPRK